MKTLLLSVSAFALAAALVVGLVEKEPRRTTRDAPATKAASSLFVEVSPLRGSSHTLVSLWSDGTLRRIEGAYLTVHKFGQMKAQSEDAKALISHNPELWVPSASDTAPLEGDLLTVAIDDQVVSSVEGRAPPTLRAFVAAVLRMADGVAMTTGSAQFLQAVPIEPEHARRLEERGTSPTTLTTLPSAQQTLLLEALREPFHLHPIDRDSWVALLDALGSRESFLLSVGTWYQIGLWSTDP